MGESDEVQRDIFKATAGIPPITKVQLALAKENLCSLQMKATLIDAPYHIVPAYYFKQWPEVHATFSDVASKALIGKREDIGRSCPRGAEAVRDHEEVGARGSAGSGQRLEGVDGGAPAALALTARDRGPRRYPEARRPAGRRGRRVLVPGSGALHADADCAGRPHPARVPGRAHPDGRGREPPALLADRRGAPLHRPSQLPADPHRPPVPGVVLPNTFFFMFASVAGGVVLGLAIAMLLKQPFPAAPWCGPDRLPAHGGAGGRVDHDRVDLQRPVRDRERDRHGARLPAGGLAREAVAQPLIVVLTDVWLQTPFYVIIILAALETTAARAVRGGAGRRGQPWQIFRNVTLPLLRPVLLVAIVIRSIDAFRVFDTVWTITKGEPGRATEVFSIYAYKEAFVFLNLDRGAAASLIGAVIIMMVGIVLYWGLRRVTEVSR